ncbi:MAG: branched-chain amino acid ABC transporter permease, partial [Clostridia bacterium]|nr:branched-chain amino acid ABC transporter permease [Clostridia bacterium]
VLGVAVAGAAGVVAAPIVTAFPGMGTQIIIDAFVVLIIGGLASLRGTVLGGLVVGFAETFGGAFISEYATAVVFAITALVLIVKPEGLLGVKQG